MSRLQRLHEALGEAAALAFVCLVWLLLMSVADGTPLARLEVVSAEVNAWP